MTTSENKCSSMSRDYMERAENYLRQGDLVQASEKSWGAAACALKYIAEQRGWRHQSHSLLNDISSQIVDETGRTDLHDMFAVAKSMHQNFYENWEPEGAVEYSVGRIRQYLAELEHVGPQIPDSFVVDTRARRRRLERLTGQSEPL